MLRLKGEKNKEITLHHLISLFCMVSLKIVAITEFSSLLLKLLFQEICKKSNKVYLEQKYSAVSCLQLSLNPSFQYFKPLMHNIQISRLLY